MRTSRKGQISLLALGAGGVLALGAAAMVMLRSGGPAANRAADVFTARRGGFEILLPVNGELVAIDQLDVRNRLDSQAVITFIVEEGAKVNAGDVLLKLNDDELRTKVADATDQAKLADAAAVAAASELDIITKERESELAKARVAVRSAELALSAWKEGEHPSKMLELTTAVEAARRNRQRLAERFDESKRLHELKFISTNDLRQDEIALLEEEARLEQAKLDLHVYERYQSVQELERKDSELEQARGELERAEQRFDAKLRSAQTDLESKKHQLESRRERHRLLEQQLSYCTLTAPTPGLVVYQSSMSGWWGGEGPPQVGTQLWPNQQVLILPDTTRMAASVRVSEALSGQVKIGQRATIVCEAMPDRTFTGVIDRVGVLAEQQHRWLDPNRRNYTVRIVLDGVNEWGLKPSMQCKAQINVGRVDDAVYVPVHSVNRRGSTSFVYLVKGQGVAEHKVAAGRASELYIEIAEGLAEGDVVLVRQPQPEEIVERLNIPDDPEKRGEVVESAAPAQSPAATPSSVEATQLQPSAETTPAAGDDEPASDSLPPEPESASTDSENSEAQPAATPGAK